ncbi:MAG: hypothetical protein KDA93_27990, partial [Planctomycetaceae bacterium]|nr:hypothetical protein [Planctomycetaceae bacterium]
FAPPALPGFSATINPSDSRIRSRRRYVFRRGIVVDAQSPTRMRVSQVPEWSVSARRPLTPRGA